MKNVMFVLRDGYDADYIISSIPKDLKQKYTFYFILESGKDARYLKFKRMIKKQGVLAFVNMFFLVLYDKKMMKGIVGELGNYSRPNSEKYYYIDDVNELVDSRIIDEINPDLVLIYGSGIIKQATINALKKDIFNIHSSVLPYYRNVHSDFWAYKNKDYDKIGITFLKLDAGIDSGDIAIQRVAIRQEKLYQYKAENLRGIVEMLPVFLDRYFSGGIELKKQIEEYATRAITPSTKDLYLFLLEKE